MRLWDLLAWASFVLLVASTGLAQPATQPGGGLAMTDEQIRQRLAEMNRRAATQQATPEAAAKREAEKLRSRERYVQRARESYKLLAFKASAQVKAQDAIAKIEREIASIRSQAAKVARERARVVEEMQAATQMPQGPQGRDVTVVPLHGQPAHYTVYSSGDDSAQRAEKARYQREIAALDDQLAELQEQEQWLRGQQQQWAANAERVMKLSSNVAKDLPDPPVGPAAADAQGQPAQRPEPPAGAE